MTMKTLLPLAGVRVLDAASFIAAPYCATIMAEFGAEVIKVEPPETGDPFRRFGTPSSRADSSLAWLSEARNKKSITLNLGVPEGAELFKRLVSVSDVVCENFRPRTLERWGLGWEDLRRVNPDLIMLRITGYGQTGPYKDRPGFARIAHAFGGLSALSGLPGGVPVTPGSTSLGDYLTGLYGAVGVLVALRHRDQGGGGQFIDMALYESVFRVLDELAPAYAYAGIVREPEGTGTRNACPHGHFPTADQRWVAIACTTDKMFKRLATAMGQPELSHDERFGRQERRLDQREEVTRIVSEWTASLDREPLIHACMQHDVPVAPLNTIADLFDDPHVHHRGNLQEVKSDDGERYVVPDVMPRLSKTPGHIATLGPSLGQHNVEIYKRLLGLTALEFDELVARLVI